MPQRTRTLFGAAALSGAALLLGARALASMAAPTDLDDRRDSADREVSLPGKPLQDVAASNSSTGTDEDPFGDEVATRAAIQRALVFLSEQQAGEADGSIPSVGTLSSRLAVSALGALAYMSAGNGPSRGPHGRELTRVVDYLLSRLDQDSTSRTRGYIGDSGDQNSRMHGHGFATLALAEAYTLSPKSARGARIGQALSLAVNLIERTQSLEGGWYYQPVRGLEHEGSITIALVQALRAAKGAGIRVDSDVIARAVDYVGRSQMENGGFRYALGSGDVTPALTAAAISTLNAAGKYHGPEVQQGFDYLDRELRARAEGPAPKGTLGFRASQEFPYYERLYLAQAFWQNPDQAVFRNWMRAERRQILKTQDEDGSWSDPRFGSTYATAINVLVLAIPDQLLPILQR